MIKVEVDELDATVKSLQAAGVKFVQEIFATPVCRMDIVAGERFNMTAP